jgi:enoyl-CoA hydratase
VKGDSGQVLVDRIGGLQVITINRPDQRNAVNAGVSRAIADALQELDADPHLSVGILTGAGGTFCAGMDLKAFLAGEVASLPGLGFGGLTERPPKKPLIGAVEGYALAGGFELVLACDLVVAGEGAWFGLPEVKRGLVARAGGLLRLPDAIPQAVALELILTGDRLDARRAASLGLVNRIVPDGGALRAAIVLGDQIASNAPLAVVGSKQVVTQSRHWPYEERFSRQQSIAEPIFASEDAREGATAFAEKRIPVWRGR